jgi:predicted alpha-1,2-mannosidase
MNSIRWGILVKTFLCLCGIGIPWTMTTGASPADYVNPMIGTAELGHVYPGATVPFGMIQLSPDTREGGWLGCAGYQYADGNLLGFSHNHLTGTGCGDMGNILFIPTFGELKLVPGKVPGEGYRARFSHAEEESRPGYYRVFLPDYKINVELTATARVGMHRYTFLQKGDGHVIVDLWHGIDNQPVDAMAMIENNHTLCGYRKSAGWGGAKVFYFVAQFSRPLDASGMSLEGRPLATNQVRGGDVKVHLDYQTKSGDIILVKVALSTVSIEGARRNLAAEMPGWSFEKVAAAARAQWNQALSVAQVETKDPDLKASYYTALYHTLLAPTLLSDVDGQFRGPDGKVHQTSGFNYYTEFSLWDTFRAEHPLLTLLQPRRVNDMINTMLAHFTILGENSLPVWVNGGKETWGMIGNHSIPVIVDAYGKGIRNWDQNQALSDMVASTEKNFCQQDTYRRLGWIPTGPSPDNDHRWQSVSKTLEFAYDDACIARFAHSLGRPNIAATHAARATNWTNVFDASVGFMRGRNSNDGTWVTPFDPYRVNFDDYTEANAWQYTFFVPHDVPGLITSMGGDACFVAKLDELFDTKTQIPNPWVDITGLIGMYSHGNEPCHHVAYLYNFAGQCWKTQERVRQIASTLYQNSPGGLCGNDDCGQTSAWYVFSALGFYPVDPATGIYVIGSPLIDKATIQLDSKYCKGKTFTVIASNNSATNKYIQSALLNGRVMSRSWITHQEIAGGGELVLLMGAKSSNWGSEPADRPGF